MVQEMVLLEEVDPALAEVDEAFEDVALEELAASAAKIHPAMARAVIDFIALSIS